ncbi:RNA-directed DNA polymerase from mobile element jockey [Trichonephila clavipes]|nr:RNA-directed DNA polymerase from mobile element jockey [Trichonephila clavipes]
MEIFHVLKKIIVISNSDKSLADHAIENKIDELTTYIADNDPDVVALQEIFSRPSLDLNIANYTTHRKDRLTHQGGGTDILVKNSISHHSIQITKSTVESTTILIESQPSNTTICSLYNPPGSSARNLIPFFEIDPIVSLWGDYNARHTSWSVTTINNPTCIALAHLIRTSGFLLSAPNGPTRYPVRGSPTTLDFGFSCGMNDVTEEVFPDLFSDHNTLHFVISTDSSISYKRNCKILTIWSKFQDLTTNSLPVNPQSAIEKK